MEAIQSHSLLSFSSNLSKGKVVENTCSFPKLFQMPRRMEVICLGMLAPRKFMQRRKKVEVFKDAEDEANQKNWRKLMREIDELGSAVSILRTQRTKNQALPRPLVLGTLTRFKQLRKWNLVSEILEWLRTQHWWDFTEMDFMMLIIAYGKLGDFNRAERVLGYMNKKGYPPSVISQTALMEAYGKGGQYNKAEAVFRRMQSSGPQPSAITYQIILKAFVEGDKFDEAESVFETLLDDKVSPLKPDQKMFHMMIYMYKKAGRYDKARKTFAKMAERGIPQSTVTFNSLMSFETDYKEVSNIYDQMQRAGLQPDVVSYALLIKAYGRARREDEALAVFEDMLDAGVRPTRKSYNTLLDAFALSGMVEEARTVFKSMRRDKCSPDIVSYTTMLSAFVNASDMDGAEMFFRRFKQDSVEPNVVSYGTLIKGYAKVNNLDKLMEKYDEMRLKDIKPNQIIFTTIMDAHGKNMDFGSAITWFKEMESCGFPADQKAKNVLLSLAKTTEEQQEVNELVGLADHTTDGVQGVGVAIYSDEEEDDDDDDDDHDGDKDGDDEDDNEDVEETALLEEQHVPI